MNRKAVRRKTRDVSVLIWLLISLLYTSCENTPGPVTVDPALMYVQGQFVDSKQNVIILTTGYILGLQQHYISQILDGITNREAQPVNEAREIIYSSVKDSIIANGLFLDWLLERLGPYLPSHYPMMNDELRLYYVTYLQDDPILPEGDEPWAKGVSETVADKLESQGVAIVRQSLSRTRNYAILCYRDGVPSPSTIFGRGWEKLGTLEETVLFKENAAGEPFRSELWWWQGSGSDGSKGYCLALTRSVNGNDGHVDVICYGEQVNKACFYESDPAANHTSEVQGSQAPFSFRLGRSTDFYRLKSGPDLPSCLTCHAGENPFVVYPDDPTFIRAAEKAQSWMGGDLDLMGSDWYTHAAGNNPPNASPNNGLVATGSHNCTSSNCHVRGKAGRFPQITPSSPHRENYCNTVLLPAIGNSTNAPNKDFSATMPQGDLRNIASYNGQIRQLSTSCNAGSWIVVQTGVLDFGDVESGSTAMQNFRMLVLGNTSKNINVRVVGPDAGSFSVGPIGGILSPGQMVGTTVTFEAETPRRYRAELLIRSDDGEVDNAELRAEVIGPQLYVGPETIHFGFVQVGGSKLKRIVVQNNGSAELQWRIGGFTVPFNFTWFPRSGQLAPGSSEEVRVTFAPNAAGNYELELPFESNGGIASVRLIGIGPAPPQPGIFAPSQLYLGVTPIGESSTGNLTVMSTGGAPLVIEGLFIFGSTAFEQKPQVGLPMSVDPGDVVQIPLVFQPLTSDSHQGRLLIDNNAESIVVPIYGSVFSPSILVTPATLDFGALSSIGDIRSSSFLLIYNTGSAAMRINLTMIVREIDSNSNAAVDVFRITRGVLSISGQEVPIRPDGKSLLVPPQSGVPSSIASGDHLILTIECRNPGVVGRFQGEIEIFSNDVDNPNVTVTLECEWQ